MLRKMKRRNQPAPAAAWTGLFGKVYEAPSALGLIDRVFVLIWTDANDETRGLELGDRTDLLRNAGYHLAAATVDDHGEAIPRPRRVQTNSRALRDELRESEPDLVVDLDTSGGLDVRLQKFMDLFAKELGFGGPPPPAPTAWVRDDVQAEDIQSFVAAARAFEERYNEIPRISVPLVVHCPEEGLREAILDLPGGFEEEVAVSVFDDFGSGLQYCDHLLEDDEDDEDDDYFDHVRTVDDDDDETIFASDSAATDLPAPADLAMPPRLFLFRAPLADLMPSIREEVERNGWMLDQQEYVPWPVDARGGSAARLAGRQAMRELETVLRALVALAPPPASAESGAAHSPLPVGPAPAPTFEATVSVEIGGEPRTVDLWAPPTAVLEWYADADREDFHWLRSSGNDKVPGHWQAHAFVHWLFAPFCSARGRDLRETVEGPLLALGLFESQAKTKLNDVPTELLKKVAMVVDFDESETRQRLTLFRDFFDFTHERFGWENMAEATRELDQCLMQLSPPDTDAEPAE